jgi:UDPglucose 6-dehydrogenase
VICTEWEQFRALDLDRIKRVMADKPAVVDLRNIYPADEMVLRGFSYSSVGRRRRNPPVRAVEVGLLSRARSFNAS